MYRGYWLWECVVFDIHNSAISTLTLIQLGIGHVSFRVRCKAIIHATFGWHSPNSLYYIWTLILDFSNAYVLIPWICGEKCLWTLASMTLCLPVGLCSLLPLQYAVVPWRYIHQSTSCMQLAYYLLLSVSTFRTANSMLVDIALNTGMQRKLTAHMRLAACQVSLSCQLAIWIEALRWLYMISLRSSMDLVYYVWQLRKKIYLLMKYMKL